MSVLRVSTSDYTNDIFVSISQYLEIDDEDRLRSKLHNKLYEFHFSIVCISSNYLLSLYDIPGSVYHIWIFWINRIAVFQSGDVTVAILYLLIALQCHISLSIFIGVRVTWSLVLCVMFCRSLFVLLSFLSFFLSSCTVVIFCRPLYFIYMYWIFTITLGHIAGVIYRAWTSCHSEHLRWPSVFNVVYLANRFFFVLWKDKQLRVPLM